MKKGFSKVLALLLLVTMVFSLTGCGKSKGELKTTFKELSEVQWPKDSGEDVTFKILMIKNPSEKGAVDNWATDYLTEQTGIKFEFIEIAPDEKDRYNAIMADVENLPDMITTGLSSKSQIQQYGEDGLIYPLEDLLAQTKNWNEFNDVSPLRKRDLTLGDGHIYTYGSAAEVYHGSYVGKMWVSVGAIESWNEARGEAKDKLPGTTDEFKDYLSHAVNELGIIGLTGQVQDTSYGCDPTAYITNAFGYTNYFIGFSNTLVNKGFSVNDGEVEFTVVKDYYRESLEYMHELWAEGLFDPNIFSQDKATYRALLRSGEKDGGDTMPSPTPTTTAATGAGTYADGNQFSERWVALPPLVGPKGYSGALYNNEGYFGRGIGVVTKNCEYPELAVKLMDFMTERDVFVRLTGGPLGMKFDYCDESEGVALDGGKPQWKALNPKTKENADGTSSIDLEAYGVTQAEAFWSGNSVISADHAAWRLAQLADTSTSGGRQEVMLYNATVPMDKAQKDKNVFLPELIFNEEESQIKADFSTAVDSYVKTAIVTFIQEGVTDESWNDYVQTVKDAGLEELLKIMQEKYDVIK